MKKEERSAIFKKTNGFCWYCGTLFEFSSPDFCIDHVIPQYNFFHRVKKVCLKQADMNKIENLVPACRRCNSGKRHRTVEYLRDVLNCRSHGAPLFSTEQLKWLRDSVPDFPIKEKGYLFFFEKTKKNG